MSNEYICFCYSEVELKQKSDLSLRNLQMELCTAQAAVKQVCISRLLHIHDNHSATTFTNDKYC